MSAPIIVELVFAYDLPIDDVVEIAQVLERAAKAAMEEKLEELRPLIEDDPDTTFEEVRDAMRFYGASVHIPQSLFTED